MVEYSKANVEIIRYSTERTKNSCQRLDRNNFENTFKNVWWKWFATWIVTNNETKNKTKKCIYTNMSTNLKLSRAQISNIIQSGGFLGLLLSKLAGPVMEVAILLQKLF